MNDDWTPEERQLAAAFDEVGLPARPSGDRRSRLPSSGNRRLRALVAVGAVGALAAGAILVPRFAAPSSTVGSTRGTGCEVALPASWLRAAQRQLPATPKGVEPFAVSPNGEEYFAAVEAASWSGVVEVSATTGAVQRIEEFPDPTSTVNPYGPNVYPTVTSKPAVTVDDGYFDGRWLVWDQARQLKGGASASSVMAWDSTSGDVWSVAGPFSGGVSIAQGPTKDAGLIAWGESPTGASGPIRFQLYSLRTRLSTAVVDSPRQNSFGGAFFWQRTLLFDVGGHLGEEAKWHLEATAVSSGEPTEVPGPLRTLRGLFNFSASAESVVGYEQRGVTFGSKGRPAQFTIWVLRQGAEHPFKLTSFSAQGVFPGSPFGRYLTWQKWPTNHSAFIFVADLASGAFVRFPGTTAGRHQLNVYSILGGGATLVALGSSAYHADSVAVLRLNRLPSLVGCPG
jgi:hypothetical protein